MGRQAPLQFPYSRVETLRGRAGAGAASGARRCGCGCQGGRAGAGVGARGRARNLSKYDRAGLTVEYVAVGGGGEWPAFVVPAGLVTDPAHGGPLELCQGGGRAATVTISPSTCGRRTTHNGPRYVCDRAAALPPAVRHFRTAVIAARRGRSSTAHVGPPSPAPAVAGPASGGTCLSLFNIVAAHLAARRRRVRHCATTLLRFVRLADLCVASPA